MPYTRFIHAPPRFVYGVTTCGRILPARGVMHPKRNEALETPPLRDQYSAAFR